MSRNKKQKVSSEINSLAEKTFFKGHKRHQAFENHKNWAKKFKKMGLMISGFHAYPIH
jgi:hypothetical protein